MKANPLKEPKGSANQIGRRSKDDYWTKALRISELRYRRLFETAQDGILILDANSGEIMDANPFLIVRRSFQQLVRFFNDLADLTGQSPLKYQSSPPPVTETSASINSTNP